MKYLSLILYIVTIQLLNSVLTQVPSEYKEIEHEVIIHDFGSDGTDKTVSIDLPHSLKPGSTITILSQTNNRGTVNIYDKKYNNLIQLDNRIYQDKFILNSKINKKWGEDSARLESPIGKGSQNVMTILHEEEGYRIFVNGQETTFYQHRSNNTAQRLLAFNNKIFKIIYLAIKEMNAKKPKNCPTISD